MEDSVRTLQIQSIVTFYVVKEGDTWQKISSRHFRTYTRWEEIKNLNGGDSTPVAQDVIVIPA